MTLILLNHCVQRVDPIDILGDLTVERPIIVPSSSQRASSRIRQTGELPVRSMRM